MMQSDNEKMLQEIVQNTEMGKNTLDELMGLTHDQTPEGRDDASEAGVPADQPGGAHGAGCHRRPGPGPERGQTG